MQIFDPITVNGVKFENRVLRSSVGGRMCAYTGMVTDVWRNFESRFARGGVAGIISTTFSVNRFRQSPHEYPTLSEDRFVSPLRKRLQQIKAFGCRYIIQIGDPGSAVQMSLFAQPEDAASSSNGFDLLYGYVNSRVAMNENEIQEEISEFAAAARRAREAGADGVEITAEKGYIIHQFLNPGMNRRTDAWGGTSEKRFRLLEEVVKAVRHEVGRDFLLGVRLSAEDYNYLPWQNFILRWPWCWPPKAHWMGNDLAQMLKYGHQLKALSVDYLHVTSGYGFINPRVTPGRFPLEEVRIFLNMTRHLSRKGAFRATLLNCIPDVIARPLFNSGWRYQEGINLDYAARFRQETGLHVIANGGFQHRETIDKALLDGKCDFVSMARALIATPSLVNEFRQGKDAPERHCDFCNRCAGRTATSPLGCYNVERFGGSYKAMHDEIMRLNDPESRLSPSIDEAEGRDAAE
jgi:2,4-dienoyl-CoA reductase-like NADH-dependent reductase (Old Yellow Enzyme family)